MATDELNIRKWVKATKPETRPLPILVTCESCGVEWPACAVACCPACGRVVCSRCEHGPEPVEGQVGGCLICNPPQEKL